MSQRNVPIQLNPGVCYSVLDEQIIYCAVMASHLEQTANHWALTHVCTLSLMVGLLQ